MKDKYSGILEEIKSISFCIYELMAKEQKSDIPTGREPKDRYKVFASPTFYDKTVENKEAESVVSWTPEAFDKVIRRNGINSRWEIDIFSHFDMGNPVLPFVVMGGFHYLYILPYNDETKKIINTSDTPKKTYTVDFNY